MSLVLERNSVTDLEVVLRSEELAQAIMPILRRKEAGREGGKEGGRGPCLGGETECGISNEVVS